MRARSLLILAVGCVAQLCACVLDTAQLHGHPRDGAAVDAADGAAGDAAGGADAADAEATDGAPGDAAADAEAPDGAPGDGAPDASFLDGAPGDGGLTCSVYSCQDGCCDGTTCVAYAGQGISHCGTGGTACGTCPAGGQCSSGGCVWSSCAALAATCGPSLTASCCASNLVPGGAYTRSNDPGYPASVSNFKLDVFEVTVGRFRAFVDAGQGTQASPPLAGTGVNPHFGGTGWQAGWNTNLEVDTPTLLTKLNPATDCTWTGSSAGGNESRPINCVTWYEAFAFCIWDGGRLPTEAEWNYAAAGGDEQRVYPWGNNDPGADTDLAIWDCYYNGTGTCTGVTNIGLVGVVPAGNGRWGQADLAGNLAEWTLDGHADPYPLPCTDCAELTSITARMVRGGNYYNNLASFLRSGYRDYSDPTVPFVGTGFRCARSP